jgi:aspartokinase/homoserine dehydrogenase 1
LVNLEGRGLLGKLELMPVFSGRVMGDNDISVSIISQGSSERGIDLWLLLIKRQKSND